MESMANNGKLVNSSWAVLYIPMAHTQCIYIWINWNIYVKKVLLKLYDKNRLWSFLSSLISLPCSQSNYSTGHYQATGNGCKHLQAITVMLIDYSELAPYSSNAKESTRMSNSKYDADQSCYSVQHCIYDSNDSVLK